MADRIGPNAGIEVRTQAGLTKLVGYAEIEEASGLSRSTVERAWRGPWKDGEPRLPAPGKARGRAVWLAAEADAWIWEMARWKSNRLRSMARGNADDLLPEEAAEKAASVLAHYYQQKSGGEMPAEIRINILQQAPGDEFTTSVTGERFMDIAVPVVARLERFFSQFDTLQSLIIATWLFPELRQIIANGCEGGCRDVFLDPELLRHYGLRAWHHDQWEVGAAELKAIDAQKPSNRRRKK